MFDNIDVQFWRGVWLTIALLYWLAWEYDFQTSPKQTKTRTQIFLVGLFWPLIIGLIIVYMVSKFLIEMIINQRCD